ncbi:hypothetical protein PRIPAC_83873, partial [Pristionchus pacificus]
NCRMLLATWGLILLCTTAVRCNAGVFPNLCAGERKGATEVLPHEMKMTTSYKVSAVFTDWTKNTTMMIDEIRKEGDYVIEIGTMDNRIKWSTMNNQLLRSNKTDCSVVDESNIFSIPQAMSDVLPLNVSSLSDLLNSIIDKNIPGINNYSRIVSGVEGIGFVGCLNVSNSSSSVVALEVVYAGRGSLEPPSEFKNPLVLSVSLAYYSNFSDPNSPMLHRISLDFSPFRDSSEIKSYLEIPHGQVCNGLDAANISVTFPEKFEGIYSKVDSGSVLTTKLMYESKRGLRAESVVNGTALLLNKTLSKDDYLVVHDVPRGMQFVFSSSSPCLIRSIPHETIDNKVSDAIYVFLPHFDSLNFSIYNNVTLQSISVLEYRSVWENNVIEVFVRNSLLERISIYSKMVLQSVSYLAVKDEDSFGDNTDVSSLLNGCFASSSNNLVSFVLKGVPTDKVMEMREDLVSNTIAATLTNLPNATIAPYRLSFFYVEVGEGDSKKDTRVIMKVADEWDQSTEITASQFITNINKTYPRGFSFHISDTEIWTPTDDPLVNPMTRFVPSFNGYTGGSMLVMGLFMIMAGVVVGAGGVYIIFRRQNISTLAYQVFE